jgi:AbrB family looped-hinge helix DNA binding protein
MKELREYIRIVSTGGQVTIPLEVRKLFGLKAEDKVVFRNSRREGRTKPRPNDTR